jgi:nicotinate-nucleotide pyrophosphorylase (carboxylating)
MLNSLIEDFIDLAIREDLGDGDHSSLACIPKHTRGSAQLLAKEEGIIAGIEISRKIFKKLDRHSVFNRQMEEGSRIYPGDVVFLITANILSLLQAERLVLNIMQRMSGIATLTSQYVEKLKGLKTIILDTRKTTPGMRLLDKEAVRIGGGENHRFGLFDMILLKDNHIDYVGDIKEAILRAKKYMKRKNKKLKLEVEARSLDDVRKILDVGGVDCILFDNFSVPDTLAAVEIVAGNCKTESSGGITLENLRNYAECGVDYISVGALTHQIKSIDLSLKAIDY